MAGSARTTSKSLYIHVPFCVQKCAYCAFYSEPSSGDLINRYVAALIRELNLWRTIFSHARFSLAAARHRCSTSPVEQILRVLERLNLLARRNHG